jgi:hypothetical protein
MDDTPLTLALERSERALGRIERALAARRNDDQGRDQDLRSKVRDVVAELDELIGAAGNARG